MEQKVKVGDKIRIIKPWMTNGRYEKGDALTVKEVKFAGVYVQENDWYIDENEYEIIADEIIADEIKVEPVRAEESKTDKASKSVFEAGKQYVFSKDLHREASGDGWEWVRHVDDGAPVNFCPGTNLGNAGDFSILRAWCREIPAKHRYTDEQITEAKCYLAEKTFDDSGWTITKPTEAHPVAVISGPLGTGTAKCAPDDEFNAYIGLMVAFKRYHNEPLPTWIKGVTVCTT